MKKPNSAERGEFSLSPLFATAAVIIIFFIAANALPADPPTNKYGVDQPEKMVLTIDQAINMSMRTNRNIIDSQYNEEIQRYSIDSAEALFDLRLIPVGNIKLTGGTSAEYNYASGGFQLQKKTEYGTNISIGPKIARSSWLSTKRYTTDMGVTITQPLLRGMEKNITTDSVQTARAVYKTSQRNAYQTRVNTVLEIISAYYDAIHQMEMLNLYDKMVARLEGHSEIARAKEKVGLSSPMDTYRVEILLKDTEDAMITASQAFEEAKDTMKLVLAIPQNTELELIFPDSPGKNELRLDEAIDAALKNRIEIEQINQNITESQRKAAVMKQNILPDLNLVMDYGRYDTANTLRQSTGLNLDHYSVSLQIGSDIFRKSQKATYQQSLINIKKLNVEVENKKEDISSQVRKQWLSLQEAVKRMEIRKTQIRQGEEKLALAEVKFVHGMADNFDVIEAEKELQNARGNLINAEIEYAIGNYNLKAISGTLLPRN